MQSDFLKVDNFTKNFGQFTAVNDVSFSIASSEAFALLGESGCGKTTLLRCIAGLETGDSGKISVNEQIFFENKSLIPVHKRNIGLVFQDYAVFPHKSISENITFGVKDKSQKEAILKKMLALFQLDDQKEKMPDQLSGGQLQRVAIARTLASNPSLILLDEPFSNLDKQLGVNLRNELRKIFSEQKLSSILVTHDQQEAFAYADRVAVMKSGKILQCDTPENLYLNPNSLEVAEFLGNCQLVDGEAHGDFAETSFGKVPLLKSLNGKVKIVLRPENLLLTQDDKSPLKVTNSLFLGGIRELTVSSDTLKLKSHVASFEKFDINTAVTVCASCPLPAFKV
ncbi:MAG: ABC transporter ATP-binding protein [Lentisphaeraceae bacterium]|nr:ABC transporter ATP-binding protein [Lentisphaeraceae bacterium]